jgi:hypothetical protein
MMDYFFLFHFPLGLGKGHNTSASCKNDACQIPTNGRQTNKKIKKKHKLKLKLKTVATQQQLRGGREGGESIGIFTILEE